MPQTFISNLPSQKIKWNQIKITISKKTKYLDVEPFEIFPKIDFHVLPSMSLKKGGEWIVNKGFAPYPPDFHF